MVYLLHTFSILVMNTKTILEISIAAVFVISITMTAAMADIPGSLTVVSASSDGVTHVMEVEDKIKQIPANKAPDLVTFWAFAIPNPGGAPAGTTLTVDAISIHHKVNDHQAFGKAAQSSPVQGFHPHKFFFDDAFCVLGLESPKSDFKVQHKTITLEASATAFAVATGAVGTDGHEACPFGLGITSLVTPPTGLPIP